MRIRLKIIAAVSGLLASALLLSSCAVIPEDSEVKDWIKDFLIDEKDDTSTDTGGSTGTDSGTVTLPNDGGTQEPPADTGGSTDTTLHRVEYTGKNEAGALKKAVIQRTNDVGYKVNLLAFHTTELKPNTKYKCYFSFNGNYQFNSEALLDSYIDTDGTVKYTYLYCTNYVEGAGDANVFYRVVSSNKDSMNQNWFEFTSGAEGADFVACFVYFDTPYQEEAIEQAKVFLDFVNYVYVEEVK